MYARVVCEPLTTLRVSFSRNPTGLEQFSIHKYNNFRRSHYPPGRLCSRYGENTQNTLVGEERERLMITRKNTTGVPRVVTADPYYNDEEKKQ